MGRTCEEVFGGVRGAVAGGAEVGLCSADSPQIAGEGRAVARAELRQSCAVAAGKGEFLHSDRGRRRSKDTIVRSGGHHPVDCFRV